MILSERFLCALAKCFYNTNIAHSDEMKKCLKDLDAYDTYRASRFAHIIEAASRHGIDLRGKVLLELGCNDGAITHRYLQTGVEKVIGVDINEDAISRARRYHSDERIDYVLGGTEKIPLEDNTADVVISYDVFEHVSNPGIILTELRRILKPGGKVLIGTTGWYHPFAPHLWSVMPVPWAHVFFSEKTFLRACNRVYHSDWYVPNMHDLDANGEKQPDKYTGETIDSGDYLNKYLIKDFERAFRGAGFSLDSHFQAFQSAPFTRFFHRIPVLKEFFISFAWFALEKPRLLPEHHAAENDSVVWNNRCPG